MTSTRSSTAFLYGLGILTAVTIPLSSAFAQRSVQVERFRPTHDPNGYVAVFATQPPGHLKWNVGLWSTWAHQLFSVRLEGSSRRDDVIEGRWTTGFFAQLGLGKRWSLGFDWPVVFYQMAHTARLMDGGPSIRAAALGDPRVMGRFRILGRSSALNPEFSRGFGLAAMVGATAPVGGRSSLASDGAFTTSAQVIADYSVLSLGGALTVGYRHRFASRTLGNVSLPRDDLEFGLGLRAPMPFAPTISALLEVRGWTDAGAPFAHSATTGAEGDLGARFGFGDFAVSAIAGAGFTKAVGAPSFRALATVTWAPRVKDVDGDGVPDSRDACPHLAEDKDGFEDQDGCLDPDNDNDFVPDQEDQCPFESAQEDINEDGCEDRATATVSHEEAQP